MDQSTNAISGPATHAGPSQILRKAIVAVSVVLAVAFLFVAESHWPDGGVMHEGIEWVGVSLIVVCILGRTWSTLFIGGRKNRALILEGPYSITRNPLYLFSLVGAVGVGAQFGSITVALVCGFVVWVVFLWTVRREEAALLATFGHDYQRYVERVPRFWPNMSLWRCPPSVAVNPRLITTTFFDAAIFLIAIPIAELFEWLHDIHVLPTLLVVP